MKKIITTVLLLMSIVALHAQGNFSTFNDRDFDLDLLHTTGTLVGIYIFTSFIISIIRFILDGRVKSRMIEKGVSETIVEQFLQPTRTDGKSIAIKWFLVLTSIGIGLFIIDATLPLGIHSVAIMAFSIALSFLGYFMYIRRSDK
jgi:hypothetical protein